MKIQAKDVKVGNVFTECGITVEVVAIHENNLVNGTKGFQFVTKTLAMNPKMYSMKYGIPKGFSYYNKKAETYINIKN